MNKQQQVPKNSRSAVCFMLIHIQLQLPAARAQTKTIIAYLTS